MTYITKAVHDDIEPKTTMILTQIEEIKASYTKTCQSQNDVMLITVPKIAPTRTWFMV
jgi:hypothetical protein